MQVIKDHRLLTTDHWLLPITEIRSSAWLEHYTDNVGVTSSNLVGSTTMIRWGISSAG